MTVFYDISAALDTQLNAMSGLPPVAWENDSYIPVVGTLYLRATHIPADSLAATIGSSGIDDNIGVYQIDVFAPADEGKYEAWIMADNIANQFKRDTDLLYNGRTVRITRASIGNANVSGGWYQIPVVIVYQSYTAQRS